MKNLFVFNLVAIFFVVSACQQTPRVPTNTTNITVKNIKVEATIKDQIKGDKVIAYKYKAKKRYHRKVGHRQLLTVLQLNKIKTGK